MDKKAVIREYIFTELTKNTENSDIDDNYPLFEKSIIDS